MSVRFRKKYFAGFRHSNRTERLGLPASRPHIFLTGLFRGLAILILLREMALAQVAGVPVEPAGTAVVNIANLAQQELANPPATRSKKLVPFHNVTRRREGNIPQPQNRPKEGSNRAAMGLPSVQVSSPSPSASFEALGDNDTAIPPGTMGAASSNRLMTTLNSQIRIQDRTGVVISTVALDSFWASTGAGAVFDPKLTFDPFNNRWIMAAVSDMDSNNSSLLVGVSQTSDPAGSWNLLRVDADADNAVWADFPSLGFNKDWVVVSVNMLTRSTSDFSNTQLFVFTKSNLYAGTPPTITVFDTFGFTQAPAVTYDNSLGTVYLVEDVAGNSNGNGILGISTITAPSGTVIYSDLVAQPSTPNPWAFGPSGGADFAPQQSTAQKIQNGDSRIQSVVYRNGSLWVAQNAFLPATTPTRTAAQWWQLQPNGTVQQFGRVDDPSGTVFYAYPSVAVNAQSDVLLGFSIFSSSQYASGGYAFRAAADASGTMRDPVLLKAGEATYFKTFASSKNRWGDYSATVVDPVNDLDFWTIQEYASSPDFPNGNDRWGTWWGKVVNLGAPPPEHRRRSQLISE